MEERNENLSYKPMPDYKNLPDESVPDDADNMKIITGNIDYLKQYIDDVVSGKIDLTIGNLKSKNLVYLNGTTGGTGTIKEINGNTLTLTTNKTTGSCCVDYPLEYELNRPLVLSFKALYKEGSQYTSQVYIRKSNSNTIAARIYLDTKDQESEYEVTIPNGLPEEGYYLRLYLTQVAIEDKISIEFKDLQVEYDVKTKYSPSFKDTIYELLK